MYWNSWPISSANHLLVMTPITQPPRQTRDEKLAILKRNGYVPERATDQSPLQTDDNIVSVDSETGAEFVSDVVPTHE